MNKGRAKAIKFVGQIMENLQNSLLLVSRPQRIDEDEFIVYYTVYSDTTGKVTMLVYNTSDSFSSEYNSAEIGKRKSPMEVAAKLMSSIS